METGARPRRRAPGAIPVGVAASVVLIAGVATAVAGLDPTAAVTASPGGAPARPAFSLTEADATPTPSACGPEDVGAPLLDPRGPVTPSTLRPSEDRSFRAARRADFGLGFDEWDLCGPSTMPRASSVVRIARGYDATPAARASIPGGAGNKYARTLWGNTAGSPGALSLGEGQDFTYGLALWLQPGFSQAMQSYFVPIRWDNFGRRDVSRGGIAMYDDGALRLFRERDGVEKQVNLLGDKTFRLTEGEWHWLEVRQRLSTSQRTARNELRVDGVLVGSSTAPNYYGEPVTAVRYGIVAIDGGRQTRPLTVYYDRAVLGSGRLGPSG